MVALNTVDCMKSKLTLFIFLMHTGVIVNISFFQRRENIFFVLVGPLLLDAMKSLTFSTLIQVSYI